MKKMLLLLALVLIPSIVFAGSLAQTFDGLNIQGASSNPLANTLITDGYSHTVSLKDAQGRKYTWFNMNYNGSGTCLVRIMKTTTKVTYPAFPVSSQTTFGRVVNKEALYVNYSSCKGTTWASGGAGNSVLELQ